MKRSRLPRNLSGAGSAVTPRLASSMIRARLALLGLSNRVSARTVGFSDLARTSIIYVTVHDWKPSSRAKDLEEFSKQHNFYVEFD